jgi:hypothetical protein
MADNVTGSFGGQNVFLENAATEATLQLLLKATLATTSEQKKVINDLVQKAGMDPAKVEEANKGLSKLGQSATLAGGALGGLNSAATSLNKGFNAISSVAEKLTDNQGKASDFFATFAGMGGVIGLVAGGFQKVAAFQEANLEMYQNLSQSGINFGGSLTDMRLAASKMGLSMEEFGRFMKENSQAFANMGSNANEGAQSFKNLSIQMYNSNTGRELRALGLTTAEVNSSMANYISMTGGRTRKEMQNSDQLIAETQEYVEHLQVLSDITGKNRKEEEEKLKQMSMQAAWENYIAKLRITDPEAAKKATAGLQEALTRGGKGAAETFQQQSMGFAGGMTESSRKFMGISQNAAAGVSGLVAASKDSSKSLKDMSLEGSKISYGLKKDAEAYGDTGAAISLMGKNGEEFNNQLKASTLAINQGMETEEDFRKQAADGYKELDKRKKSEADQAARNKEAFQKLGQQILEAVIPLFNRLAPYLLKMGEGLQSALKWINETPGALRGVAYAAGALALAFTAVKTAQGYQATKAAFGLGGGGGAGGGKGAGGVLSGLAGGEGAGKALKGISGGLKSFANPKILVGATIFGAAITIIGAGIAGAAWILGKALPTFAEGLQAFDELDGENLKDVGLGVVQLGAGLIAFGAGGAIAGVGGVMGGLAEGFGKLFGVKSPIEKMMEFAKLGPELKLAGDGIASFNNSLASLLKTDSASIKNLSGNLTNLAGSLKELREASKPVEKSFLSSAADALKSALTPETTKAPPEGTAGAKVANKTDADKKASAKTTTVADVQESLRNEVAKLNSTSMELLRAMRESAENTKKTASILASRGNLLRG